LVFKSVNEKFESMCVIIQRLRSRDLDDLLAPPERA